MGRRGALDRVGRVHGEPALRSWRSGAAASSTRPTRLAPVRREAHPHRRLTGVDRQDLLFVVLPFVALALFSVGFVVLFRHRWRMDRAAVRRAARLVEPDIVTPPRDPTPGRRPWWGSPWLWVGVSVGFAVLGLLVWRPLVGRRVPVRPVRVDLAAQVAGGGSAVERTREARRPVLAGPPPARPRPRTPRSGRRPRVPSATGSGRCLRGSRPARRLNSVPMVRRASGGQYSSRSPDEEHHRRAERPQFRTSRDRRKLDVARLERDADQHERGHALVVERFAERDVGTERPPADDARKVRRFLAHPPDRGARVADLVAPSAERAAGAHHAAEVERQDGEAA